MYLMRLQQLLRQKLLLQSDEKMCTNLPGVFAIGDIRNTPLRQIVTAVSDGAIAAVSSNTYVKSLKARNK